jgi:signal transduction histidine kinase
MPRRFPRARATLAVKLALVFFGAVAGALAIVYLMVVPRLEGRLVDAKINEVERASPAVLRELLRADAVSRIALDDAVNAAAQNLNGRVAVLDRLGPDSLLTDSDSAEQRTISVARDPVALRAAATLEPSSGRVEREGHSFAEVAVPVGTENVVLLSAPLGDALANVRLVSSSLVVAGLVALAAAAAAAYAAAYGLTRRLRLLEAAADRIAAGDFTVPIEAGGSDEIAELAREFDLMRLRLADLDRARREFIANASHELRTPLFSLGGFLELMADEELDADTRREFLDETRAQVTRLTRLATDLLDLSRLDAGQIQVVKREVDLAEAARTVGEEFRVVADASEHPLDVQAPDPVPALGDHQRVLQIGRILVENALRHTPSGTRVDVRASAIAGKSTLSVRDEGPGIAADHRGHIFQRFYRAGGAKASGSGLGLAIAHELATRMGGGLSVESAPGETVFTLALASSEAAFPRENAAAPSAEAGVAASRRSATTL